MHPEKFMALKCEIFILTAPAGKCYQVSRSCPLSASVGLSCPPPPPPWWPRSQHNLEINPASRRVREVAIDPNVVDTYVFTGAFEHMLTHFCLQHYKFKLNPVSGTLVVQFTLFIKPLL